MPNPGYDIAHFYNTVTRRGLARNNLYRVKSIGEIFSGTDNADLLIFAKDGAVPSRTIETQNINYKDFNFTVPMAAKYPENTSWAVNFYSDKNYVIRGLFEAWSRSTYDEHQHTQERSFALNDIEISLLDNSSSDPKNRELKEIRTYKLVGTFPVNIGQIQYNAGSSGEFVTLSVNIAFQYVVVEQLGTGGTNEKVNLTPAPLKGLDLIASNAARLGGIATNVAGTLSRVNTLIRGFGR